MERRASASLASLFALRMLGLFLILPVFSVHARSLPGGEAAFLVGLALGIFGLMQAALQIPFGMASDRFGRKPVIIAGLIVFAIGSVVAAMAQDVTVTIIGRAIQGAGAISAAVVALLADLTSDEHRTKAMAMVGGTIGVSFALSLVAAPALYEWIGMSGIFWLTAALAVAGVVVTWRIVPPEAAGTRDDSRAVKRASLGEVLTHPELVRLNVGVFVLHAMQMALFVVVPVDIVRNGLSVGDHWKIYLPVVLLSFLLMVPPIILAERRGKMKPMFLGAIVLLLAVEIGLAMWSHALGVIIGLLLAYFVAFNILEAVLPSLVSKIAPPSARGTAIGVYNTTQSIGLFFGGAMAGWLMQHWSGQAVFVFGILLVALWLIVAMPMRPPTRSASSPLGGAKTNEA